MTCCDPRCSRNFNKTENVPDEYVCVNESERGSVWTFSDSVNELTRGAFKDSCVSQGISKQSKGVDVIQRRDSPAPHASLDVAHRRFTTQCPQCPLISPHLKKKKPLAEAQSSADMKEDDFSPERHHSKGPTVTKRRDFKIYCISVGTIIAVNHSQAKNLHKYFWQHANTLFSFPSTPSLPAAVSLAIHRR